MLSFAILYNLKWIRTKFSIPSMHPHLPHLDLILLLMWPKKSFTFTPLTMYFFFFFFYHRCQRNINQLPAVCAPTRDQTRNLDWALSLQSFGVRDNAPTNRAAWPGPSWCPLDLHWILSERQPTYFTQRSFCKIHLARFLRPQCKVLYLPLINVTS